MNYTSLFTLKLILNHLNINFIILKDFYYIIISFKNYFLNLNHLNFNFHLIIIYYSF